MVVLKTIQWAACSNLEAAGPFEKLIFFVSRSLYIFLNACLRSLKSTILLHFLTPLDSKSKTVITNPSFVFGLDEKNKITWIFKIELESWDFEHNMSLKSPAICCSHLPNRSNFFSDQKISEGKTLSKRLFFGKNQILTIYFVQCLWNLLPWYNSPIETPKSWDHKDHRSVGWETGTKGRKGLVPAWWMSASWPLNTLKRIVRRNF